MIVRSSSDPDVLVAASTEAVVLRTARLRDEARAARSHQRRRQLRTRIAQLEEELARLEAEAAVEEEDGPRREDLARQRLAEDLSGLLEAERARSLESGRCVVVGLGRDEDGVVAARLLAPVQAPERLRMRPDSVAEARVADAVVGALRDLAEGLELVGVKPEVSEEFGVFLVELRLGKALSVARAERTLRAALHRRRRGLSPLRLVWLAWWLYEPEDDDYDADNEVTTLHDPLDLP
jgi:predicted Holliday junction resolvase-like endonuclease